MLQKNTGNKKQGSADLSACPAQFTRNWAQYPALVEINDTSRTLYAIGDIHGDFDDLIQVLTQIRVIQMIGSGPADVRWTGGKSIFVFLGDLIDKGSQSVDVLMFIMTLEQQASAAGGLVVSVAGNHEMGFLANPNNSKTKEFRSEIERKGLELCKHFYSAESYVGKWLRNRPAAAIINGVYLSHSGWAAGALSRSDVATQFMNAVDGRAFDSPFTCGNHNLTQKTPGFFNAEIWWGDKGKILDRQTAVLGVSQILFGHDPGAFAEHGKARAYFVSDPAGSRGLFKMDVDMFEGVGNPSIYLCRKWRPGGGCFEPKLFIRKDKNSSPEDIRDFPINKGNPPSEKKPEPRPDC